MTKEKAISIIIPCYNSKNSLPHCVSSLLNQTIGLENLELIFIDDASTDDTLEYLYQLEERFSSIVTVISYSNNQKSGAARNIGMNYATGKYIGFVDSDDWILPQMYEEMYHIAEKQDCELVSSQIFQTDSLNKRPKGRFKEESYDYLFQIQNETQRKQLLAKGVRAFGTVNPSTKLYRRDFIEKYKLRFGEKYAFEDLYFLNMIAFYINKYYIMQAEYYQYYTHPNSTMTSMNCIKWFEQRKILIHWIEDCINRGLYEQYYYEIELMFGRDYYIGNLHYAFTHFNSDAIPVIQNSLTVMKTLFPNAEKNPYILQDNEHYLYNCQKKLFNYLSYEVFTYDKIINAKRNYGKEIVKIVREKSTDLNESLNIESDCETINIMLASDKNYFYPTMVLVTSLFYHHPDQKMIVYLLQKDFSKQNLDEIQYFSSQWKYKEIFCIEVPSDYVTNLKEFGRFSIAAYFRILGMILVPESVYKILYLDTDMIVNSNLSELFLSNMKMPLGVCYDINNYIQGNIEQHKTALNIPSNYSYFNDGMLLMDLVYMRKNNIAKKLISDIEKHFHEYALVDQDAFNKHFYKNVEYLPWQKYNCPCIPLFSNSEDLANEQLLITYPEFYQQDHHSNYYDLTESFFKNASIIHYCTSQKPWKDYSFYKYKNMTEAIRIYNKYEEIYHHLKENF